MQIIGVLKISFKQIFLLGFKKGYIIGYKVGSLPGQLCFEATEHSHSLAPQHS
jgi:hypothetical protein